MGRAKLALAFAAAGCYGPASEAPCTVRCDDGVCPASLVCGGDHVCRAPGGSCMADAANPDAAADAPHDGPPDAAIPPPMLVQDKITSGSTTSLALNLPAMPTAGDLLVIFGANNGGILMTPSGGGVASWMLANRADACANTEIWYGVTDGSSSGVTITGSSTKDMYMLVAEWSGLATPNAFDVSGFGIENGMTTTPAPGGITTHAPRELVVLSVASTVSPFMAPSPGTWQPLQTVSSGSFAQGVWYMLPTATGTFAPSIQPASPCWGAVIAGFRAP